MESRKLFEEILINSKTEHKEESNNQNTCHKATKETKHLMPDDELHQVSIRHRLKSRNQSQTT